MVLILLAIALSFMLLIWFWKGPLKKLINAMKKNGINAFEAYAIITVLGMVVVAAGYMIYKVVS